MQRYSIDVQNVTVAYHEKIALDSASLRVAPGVICGLVGQNGSGKSTLFKSIMGFVTPLRGRVLLEGVAPVEAQKRQLVAYVPQAEDVDWTFPVSVDDVVMMGRYGFMNFLRMPRAEDRAIAQAALERVQMTDFRGRQIGELSGGQRKRVFLARALAQQGRLLLLDEPFTGVDAKTQGTIIELLLELRRAGQTILISTHDLASVTTFCDEVALVNRTVLAHGPTATVFNETNIARTFGIFLPQFAAQSTTKEAA